MSGQRENPFSAARIRPGTIQYRFGDGQSAASLIDRLRLDGWRGEIVGPHGSGKSTLLATLINELKRQGHATCLIELRDGQRRMPEDWKQRVGPASAVILFIDGYEQLSHFSRAQVRWWCRQRKRGLVVSTHCSVGLPRLYETRITDALAWQVIRELSNENGPPVESSQIRELLRTHDGNLREVLFDLYDRYEAARGSGNS